jgi:hypothetical protein
LFLLVKPTGGKYWRLQYRIGGKQKLLALGVYPHVSLVEAREQQAKARKLISNGLDPVAAKREQKRLSMARAENSFERVAREWHENQKGRWSTKHAFSAMQSMESEVFPVIGPTPIHDIQVPALLEAIRRIEKRGALDVASRALQRVNAVFSYAISRPHYL